MKKMLLATALALLITGCAQQTFYCSKQTGGSTKGNHHPSFLRFWNWAEEKTVDAAKICGGAENVVKTETQQTFVNGLLGFIMTFMLRWKRVYVLTIIAWVPIDMGSSIYCSLIYFWGSFRLFFCLSDQPLSEE